MYFCNLLTHYRYLYNVGILKNNMNVNINLLVRGSERYIQYCDKYDL